VKEGVGIGPAPAKPVEEMRAACFELDPQVTCLELEVAGGCCDGRMLRWCRDQRGVEAVATSGGLCVHRQEIRGHGGEGDGRVAKAVQLGVVAVTASASFEDALCKERLSPERDEPLRVKVLRVKRPEPHSRSGGRLGVCEFSGATRPSLQPESRPVDARRDTWEITRVASAATRASQAATGAGWALSVRLEVIGCELDLVPIWIEEVDRLRDLVVLTCECNATLRQILLRRVEVGSRHPKGEVAHGDGVSVRSRLWIVAGHWEQGYRGGASTNDGRMVAPHGLETALKAEHILVPRRRRLDVANHDRDVVNPLGLEHSTGLRPFRAAQRPHEFGGNRAANALVLLAATRDQASSHICYRHLGRRVNGSRRWSTRLGPSRRMACDGTFCDAGSTNPGGS
jgi:hypothetical protein